MNKYLYYKEQLAGLSFPYACLDTASLNANIQTNLLRAGSKKIRIASKSIRCVEVMRRIQAVSDQFQGIMTYHAAEAIWLAQEGFDDLLMGYPIVDQHLIEVIGDLIQQGKYICLMVDTPAHLNIINAVGKSKNVQFPVCLDIDLSDNYPGLRFGVWRSSIETAAQLDQFLLHLQKMEYIRLDGLMGYEAQIAGVVDKAKGGGLKNKLIRWLKNRSIQRVNDWRQKAADQIQSHGINLRFINGGGTGSLESTIQEEVVTEVTVGSGFYNSHLFDHYQNFQLKPALFYAIPIVREPKPGVYTCHGGGFIASGGIEPIKAPSVFLPENGRLDPLEGAGEVQTPIRFAKLHKPLQLGDPIFMRHAKAGELCERFDQIYFLEKDQLEAFQTYRGMGKNFG